MEFLYIAIYFVVFFAVPSKNWQRGYIWLFMRKLPPFRFWKGEGFFARIARHLGFSWGLIPLLSPFPTEIYWLVLCVVSLDDYLNGDDDDRKRRWEGVKNKVKWLWTPQMEPAPIRGGL